MMVGMRRRALLRAAAAAALAACQPTVRPTPAPTTARPSVTASPPAPTTTATSVPTAAQPDWAGLMRDVRGGVIRPGDAPYDRARGLGVLSRAWGLTCDSLVSADIVTADGRVLTCDERREPELFWALRGAGMGSFGVVTSLVLRTQPVTSLALGSLEFPWSLASG